MACSLARSDADTRLISRLALTAFSLLALLNILNLWSVKEPMLAGYGDMPGFYATGLMLARGAGDRLYNLEQQAQIYSELFPDAIMPDTIFNHLPYEALAWSVIARLPYPVAVFAVLVANLLILASLSVALKRRLRNAGDMIPLPWFVPMLACFPVYLSLANGQTSIAMLALYSISFMLFKRHERASGFVLALGLFKPQLVLPFLAIEILQRRWRFLAGFALGAILVLAISLSIVGLGGTFEFTSVVINLRNRFGSTSTMPNLRGLLFMLAPVLGETASLVLTLTASAALVLWVGLRKGLNQDTQFALGILVVLLTSYHMHAYDLTLIILPLLILLNQARNRSEQYNHTLIGLSIILLFAPAYLPLIAYGLGCLMALAVLSVVLFVNVQDEKVPIEIT
ncbi:MAG TPA: glycosyltransferase family 87 protein [Blastocatellia bacterium]|nr:glycosyltransferase family 87 protein [Blastocatellia bacterium]